MKTIQTLTTVLMLLFAANPAQIHAGKGNTYASILNSFRNAAIGKDADEKKPDDKDAACTPPTKPGTISGSPIVCFGIPATYSVSPVPGATTYSWTVVGGAIIGSRTGPTITVRWSWSAKSVSVKAVNDCGSSASQTLAIKGVINCSLP